MLQLIDILKKANITLPANLDNLNIVMPKIVADSRLIQPGDIFIALQGEQQNGHHFVKDAFSRGAIAAIISEETSLLPENKNHLIRVQDTLKALGQIAKAWREQFTMPVVGITGSCGKTSVKEFTAKVLETEGHTLKNQGNFNNEIGLPMTLLSLKPEHQYAVIEMGARFPNDIATLCALAKPTIGVVTNIANAHLEIFGNIETIAKTKGELYSALPNDGMAIVNHDDPFYDYFMQNCVKCHSVTFGLNAKADYNASEVILNPLDSEFILNTPFAKASVRLPIPGLHNIANALAASAVGGSLGLDIESIVKGLESYVPVGGRLKITSHLTGAKIIDDTYNANPRSMLAAIEVLSKAKGEKIFVMGDMLELGPKKEEFHHEMGLQAKKYGIQTLLTVGPLSQEASKGFKDGSVHYSNQEELIHDLKKRLNANVTVLVKGSRGSRMDKIVTAIMIQEGK